MDLSSLSTYYGSLASQVSPGTQKISGMSEEEIKAKSDEELMDVCKQFESYLLEQVFKEMDKTTSLFGDGSNSETPGMSNQLVSYFKDQTIAELSSQSTNQNGLGLAQTLYEQMKRNYEL